MAAKNPRPSDARRVLKRMWTNVAVYSCADGTLRIEPTWNKAIYGTYTPKDGGGPGMFSRMHSAYLVECLMMLPRKKVNWKKRAESVKAASTTANSK